MTRKALDHDESRALIAEIRDRIHSPKGTTVISDDRFRKSSFSGAPAAWRSAACPTAGSRYVTARTGLPPHHFTPTEWNAFLAGVRAGEFDLN